MAYDVSGIFHEVCDCEVVCSCWAGLNPEMGTCTGMFLWEIDQGEIGGKDVAGLKVVAMNYGTDCLDGDRLMLVIDPGSTIPGRFADFAAVKAAVLTAFTTGTWKAVVHATLDPAWLHCVQGTVTVPDRSSGAPASKNYISAVDADGALVAEANVTFRGGGTLRNSSSTSMVRKVTGLAAAEVDVGHVVARPRSAEVIGFNLLAEVPEAKDGTGTVQREAFIFDIDITRVTAMRGQFHYHGL